MERGVHKIDASGQIAGRLASEIAFVLQGKNKATYDLGKDNGDSVEVINVAEMKFSGKKIADKVYHRNTGYPGGIRTEKLSELFAKNPGDVLRRTVKNMLPKNRLQVARLKRLIIK